MNRREFMRSAAIVGAATGLARLSRTWAMVPTGARKSAAVSAALQADSDRSPERDPLALQRSTLVVCGLDSSAINEDYLGMLKVGGVNCWYNSMNGGIQSFADAYNFFDAHRHLIVPATTVREIRQARQQSKTAFIFGWQDANVLADAPGEPPPTALRAYHQLGLRICGIAYNVANIFGSGCLEPHIGLTRAGRRLVEEIHKLSIVLDIGGHTGEQTSLDAIAISAGVPVICSHTNLAALNDNPRCISDRLCEAIAKTGGVIGITAFNDFHARRRSEAHIPRTPQVSLEKHLDQYDYLRKLVGVEHIGLGPDFIHGRTDIGPLNRAVTPPEAYSELPWRYVKGFESIVELPNVTRGLIQRGWSSGEIRKLLGENWLRVYEKVWGG